jgi:UDP-3-O-[3-hydroxymyristoyl] N-acetylglucosamine deacetylase/3-hydroxyacyl-[acyl-carrier-protein] dehydratase
MTENQRTVQKPVTFTGRGLHTGVEVEMTFLPAEENTGLRFIRTDLKDKPVIRAFAENVVDTSRGTTLEENGVRVATVEHTLAALTGLGIDNVIINVNGPEAPILDGSSIQVIEGIQSAGIKDLKAKKSVFVIEERIEYIDQENGIEIIAYPDKKLSIDVKIDYNSKVLGFQYALLENMDNFVEEIGRARTFVFLHELEFLLKNNLIKGGDINNAIVIIDKTITQQELDRLAELFHKPKIKVQPEGILNNVKLNYSNEAARHKLLDFIGDMALIGHPIQGKIIATRPGHFANNQFARLVRDQIKKDRIKKKAPKYDLTRHILDINDIMKMLPHRPPFLLVDKILYRDQESVVGIKNVTINEGFFVGHFPDEPIMPAVLQVEAMAQVGGILVLNTVPDPEKYSTYFLRIENARFKRKVVPGDTLLIKCNLLEPIRRGLAHMFCQVFVGEDLAAEGDLLAQIVKV